LPAPAKLRVGFFLDNGIMAPGPAIRRAVREAVARLTGIGVAAREWQPPGLEEAWDLYLRLLYADGMRAASEALRGSVIDTRTRQVVDPAGMPPMLMQWGGAMMALAGQRHFADAFSRVRAVDAAGLQALVERCAAYRRRFFDAMDASRLDAIVCPPDALPALLHGTAPYVTDALGYCAVFNLLDMPAGVVTTTRIAAAEESDRPASIDLSEMTAARIERGSAGLPVGVQVAARPWREDVVLSLMRALEPGTLPLAP
jgi:Asp-tRNA(Asn)/Glu-tRNA(Gln) amidotransferase A subunit family amidase